MEIDKVLETIEEHLETYRKESDSVRAGYEHGMIYGAIEALTDLRNEFAQLRILQDREVL